MRPRLSLVLAGMLLTAQPSMGGDGVVALQTADPSCRTTTAPPPRYVNCGNGTVTDNKTGLVWLRKANCFGVLKWHEAVDMVANLSDIRATSVAAIDDCGLADGSSPGEWRLPSTAEWEEMVEVAADMGCAPTITNDQGDGCWASPPACFLLGKTCSFTGVQASDFYWSATSLAWDYAWGAHMSNGTVAPEIKDAVGGFMWPVRGGQ